MIDRYLLASILLIFFTVTCIITSIFLFIAIPIGSNNFYFSIAISCGFFLIINDDKKKILTHSLTAAIIIIFLINFSQGIIDGAWDSESYHKQAVGFLKNGWNPVYQSNLEYNALSRNNKYPKDFSMIFSETYPKAAWYFSAVIYSLTGKIDAGKMYNLLFAVITYLFFSEYMKKKRFHRYQYGLIAFIVAFNPILLAQFETHYVDGIVSCVVMLLMLLFMQVIDGRDDIKSWLNIGSLIIIGCNLKFSGALYVGTLSIGFMIYYILINKENRMRCFIRFKYLFLSALISFFVVGFSPYITNVMRYNNLLSGAVGGLNSQSIFQGNNLISSESMEYFFGIKGLSNTQMFFLSLFGKMSHGQIDNISSLLKIPFTFQYDEIKQYFIPDPRIGGFGIFFSGIFLLSIVAIIMYIRQQSLLKEDKKAINLSMLFLGIIFLEVLFLPATYNARIVGYMYFFVYAGTFLSFLLFNKSKLMKYKYIAIVICIFSILNIAPYSYPIVSKLDQSIDTKSTLQFLKEESEMNKHIKISFYKDEFSGMHYTLQDHGIKYEYINCQDIDETFIPTYGWRMFYKIEE